MEILRLKEILDEKGMPQTELARITGLSKVYISDVVNNKKFPRKETLFLIAQALDVDIRELFISTKDQDLSDPKEAIKAIGKIVAGVLN